MPDISVINAAAGAGVNMVLRCGVVIAFRNASRGQAFCRIGLTATAARVEVRRGRRVMALSPLAYKLIADQEPGRRKRQGRGAEAPCPAKTSAVPGSGKDIDSGQDALELLHVGQTCVSCLIMCSLHDSLVTNRCSPCCGDVHFISPFHSPEVSKEITTRRLLACLNSGPFFCKRHEFY